MPYSPVLDGLCEQGRCGQKTKAGVYLYADGRTAVRDPEVERSIAAFSQSQNIARREISKSEIVDRCVLALVNEGAKILEDGIAQRASDIDEIGRASCRERVCQYVTISVVAVSLKKKKIDRQKK